MMDPPVDTCRWSWFRGVRRAVVWGTCTAVVLAVPLDVLARYAPGVVLNLWIRAVLAFFVAWILFAVVQWAAGIAGTVCTTIVLVLGAAVFLSQHWVFAAYGLPTRTGIVAGSVWFDPTFIALTNLPTFAGMAFATVLCHEGGSIWRTVVEVLGSHIRG